MSFKILFIKYLTREVFYFYIINVTIVFLSDVNALLVLIV
jgi:hypothetical protein